MRLTKRTHGIDISFILTFLIIYVSNDTLLFGTNVNRLFFYIHVGILVLATMYTLFCVKKISKNAIIYTLCFSVAIIITQIANHDVEIVKYVYNLLLLFLCLFFTAYISLDRFCKSFVSVMYYISLFAIIAGTIQLFAPTLVQYLPKVINAAEYQFSFYGLGFLIDANGISRLYGIFREPGVFAIFLSLSLILQLFYLQKFFLRKIIITIIAIFFTFSTAAYILAAAILLIHFVEQIVRRKYRKKNAWAYYLAVSLVVVALLTFIGLDTTYQFVFGKLTGENDSLNSRFGSIAANFRIFLQNPVFGKGWSFVEDNFIAFAEQGVYSGDHNTNTFMKFLALYGIGPFVVAFCLNFQFFKKVCKSAIWGVLITIIWVAAMSNEDLSVNILFYLLPMYALCDYNRREETACENTIH